MKSIICVICLMLLSFTAGCRSWAEEGDIILEHDPSSLYTSTVPWSVPTEKAKKFAKQRILKELAKRGKIETNEVADLFKVSILTAFRYLEELEQEGKIEQIRVTGRGVEYKLYPE